MSMKIRLLLLIIIPLLVLGLVGFFTAMQMREVEKINESMMDIYTKAFMVSSEMVIDLSEMAVSKITVDQKAWEESIVKVEKGIEDLEKVKIKEIEDDLKDLKSTIEGMKSARSGKERMDLIRSFLKVIKKVSISLERCLKESQKDLEGKIHITALLQMWLPLGVMVAAILFGVYTVVGMFKYLNPLMKASKMLEVGDLTFEFEREYEGNDEITQLLRTFQIATTKLKENMKVIKTQTEDVSTNVDVISSSMEEIANNIDDITNQTNDIAKKIENISASVQQTTAGAEEISSATKSIADNAQEASAYGTNSLELAKNGSEIIKSVIENLKNITEIAKDVQRVVDEFNEGAGRITDFVETIASIADQTNLLALNAAIEAARAGEAGKGFAVVADEIRKLAEESRKAAEEITKVVQGIGGTVKDAITVSERISQRIEEGSKLADQADEKLKEIITSMEKITSMMENIAAAVEEQSASVDEIAQAMTMNSQNAADISAATEETTANLENINASVEEITASIKNLKNSVENLKNEVAMYKVNGIEKAHPDEKTDVGDESNG